MRDLLDLLHYLTEDDDKQKTLSPGVLLKRPGRFEAFIQYITDGNEFKTMDGHLVRLDPTEAERLLALHNSPGGTQFKGAIKVKLDDGNIIPLSSLLKTAEFGGQKEGSATSDSETGEEQKKKAGYRFNPANIKITDQEISADDFGDMIVRNDKLNATPEGRVVVLLAQEIMAGEGAILPDELRDGAHKDLRSALTDDAGEYLGVLALLYNQSEFPKRAEFEKWLGGKIEDLILRFPSKQNERLADSYAQITNKKTNHEVKISSKGSGGGAPPAMSGLKIPDNMRNNKRFAALVEFVDMCANTPTKEQPFKAMNIIHKYNPSSLPKKFNKFLPWKDKDYQMAEESLQLYKANRKQEARLPEKYQSIWADTVFKGDSSDGGRMMYMIKKASMDAINMNDAIPNFEGGVLNILDMNFVQQYAEYKGGQIHFKTQWPAKLDGVVTVESKAGATDPTKGGFSFKLAPKAEEYSEPEMSTGPDGEENFAQSAAQIAGEITKSSNPEKEIGDISRRKR